MSLFEIIATDDEVAFESFLQDNLNLIVGGGCTNRQRFPLIHRIVQKSSSKCLKVAIRLGMDVNIVDDRRRSAVYVAARHGFSGLLSSLINAGANVETKCASGFYPIHVASANGRSSCLKLLSGAGCSLDVRDNNGRTAAHLAAYCGKLQSLILLHALGANMDLLDNHRRNPWWYSYSRGYVRCAAFVETVATRAYAQGRFKV